MPGWGAAQAFSLVLDGTRTRILLQYQTELDKKGAQGMPADEGSVEGLPLMLAGHGQGGQGCPDPAAAQAVDPAKDGEQPNGSIDSPKTWRLPTESATGALSAELGIGSAGIRDRP